MEEEHEKSYRFLTSIPIICGNPRYKPATSTRFVLPFAYALGERRPYQDGSLAYHPLKYEDDPNWAWRFRYLTEETSEALFRRAKWFMVPEKEWQCISVHLPTYIEDGSKLPVRFAPPTLVLFEGDPIAAGEAQPDLLQIGFLIVEMYFPECDQSLISKARQPELDDLLLLNEVVRYWRRPFPRHENEEEHKYGPVLKEWPVSIINPKGPKISDPKGLDPYLDRWATLLAIPIKEDLGYRMLFPKDWQYRENRKLGENGWDVYADSRSYVWTCAIMDEGGNKLRNIFPHSSESSNLGKPTAPWSYGHWVKLLNVDRPGGSPWDTHQCREFEREWARDRTYNRWEELGTFYGFSYHSGAMLGPTMINKKYPEKTPDPPLWRHFREMYFDQVLLILYIRMVLFRFSTQLSLISAHARDSHHFSWSDWGEDFERLRQDFALFTNLYQFPLLSNQQQGIEMYALARKCMDVDDLFREVKEEIQGTTDYLMQKRAQEQADVSNRLAQTSSRLSWLGFIGLPVALGLSFLGMSIIPKYECTWVEGSINMLLSKLGPYEVSGEWELVFCVLAAFFIFSFSLLGVIKLGEWIKGGSRK